MSKKKKRVSSVHSSSKIQTKSEGEGKMSFYSFFFGQSFYSAKDGAELHTIFIIIFIKLLSSETPNSIRSPFTSVGAASVNAST